MFLGGVAHEIVRRLPLPVIVIPALGVQESVEQHDTAQRPTALAAGT
jgi:hypothetical protein